MLWFKLNIWTFLLGFIIKFFIFATQKFICSWFLQFSSLFVLLSIQWPFLVHCSTHFTTLRNSKIICHFGHCCIAFFAFAQVFSANSTHINCKKARNCRLHRKPTLYSENSTSHPAAGRRLSAQWKRSLCAVLLIFCRPLLSAAWKMQKY